ncbi:MAG: hypothetical protein ACREHC_08930 [Candidatus Levyibacteriota bacterium]
MSKINEININIKKAVMTQINVELGKEGKVAISVKGQLLTEQGKPVSDFWFNNSTWISEDRQIEIPTHVHMLIGDIFKEMTPLIYKKLNDSYKQLPAKSVKTVPQDEMNLDDIPF